MKFKKETKIGVLLSTIFVVGMIVNAVFIAGATVSCSKSTTTLPRLQPGFNSSELYFESVTEVDGVEYDRWRSDNGDVVLHSYQD